MQRMNRWYYKGGKPNTVAKVINRASAWMNRLPFMPELLDTLEVTGRISGEPVTMPVVVVHMDGERYIVSMLGGNTNWVKNVRAANGHATLLKGGRNAVKVYTVPVEHRAPILKRYCEIAPAGRSHIPVDKDAPVTAFEKIAANYPVFRMVSR